MKAMWIVKAVVGFLALVGIGAAVVMYLWNALMPDIFHLPILSFWQALGLLILAKILFKQGGHGWMRSGFRQQYWKKKYANMTPEEKEKFKAQWEKRCGKWAKSYDDSPDNSPSC